MNVWIERLFVKLVN